MNRIQKRNLLRNFKRMKGLQKKHTKGAFGRPPQYIMDNRKLKEDKKLQQKSEVVKNQGVTNE